MPADTDHEPGLSARRSIVAGTALAAAALLLAPTAPVERLEGMLLDAQFAWLRANAPKTSAPEIVIVGIDEATLEAFPEPIALWHHRLAGVIDAIAQARPRALGIDVQLPERSFDAALPGSDAALTRALAAARAAAPTVIALGLDASGRARPVHAPFLAVLGAQGAGLAAWQVDADGVVRRFDERLGEGGAEVPTFAGVLARALGLTGRPGLIDVTLGPAFDYLPAHALLEWNGAQRAQVFAGRIVLLGSVLPFADRHRMAVAGLTRWSDAPTVPGIVTHAQALRTLVGPGVISPAPWIAHALAIALAAGLWFALRRPLAGAALGVVAALGALGSATALLAQGIYLPMAWVLLVGLIAGGARSLYEAWSNARARAHLRASFAGAVSPPVLDLILRGELDSALGSGRRDVCVMFADVRGFTPLTESNPPEEVVALLNRYFTRVVTCVHAHGGTVDNFRGDGILAIFGAPLPAPEPCREGFAAAQAMLEAVARMSAELAAEGRPPIRIGIALAFGSAVVGRVGAAFRNEYTAIGDCANVAARIESLGPELGYPLVLDAAAARALGNAAMLDDLGERILKGHSPVRVFGWPARSAS